MVSSLFYNWQNQHTRQSSENTKQNFSLKNKRLIPPNRNSQAESFEPNATLKTKYLSTVGVIERGDSTKQEKIDDVYELR